MENNSLSESPKMTNSQKVLYNFRFVVNSLRNLYGWSNTEIVRELGITAPTFYRWMDKDKTSTINSTTKAIMKSLILRYNYEGFAVDPTETWDEYGCKKPNEEPEELSATLTRVNDNRTTNSIIQSLNQMTIKEWSEEIAKLIAKAPKGVSITISFA
jgi:hypothetical protein